MWGFKLNRRALIGGSHIFNLSWCLSMNSTIWVNGFLRDSGTVQGTFPAALLGFRRDTRHEACFSVDVTEHLCLNPGPAPQRQVLGPGDSGREQFRAVTKAHLGFWLSAWTDGQLEDPVQSQELPGVWQGLGGCIRPVVGVEAERRLALSTTTGRPRSDLHFTDL